MKIIRPSLALVIAGCLAAVPPQDGPLAQPSHNKRQSTPWKAQPTRNAGSNASADRVTIGPSASRTSTSIGWQLRMTGPSDMKFARTAQAPQVVIWDPFIGRAQLFDLFRFSCDGFVACPS